jgi:hypothetical protein
MQILILEPAPHKFDSVHGSHISPWDIFCLVYPINKKKKKKSFSLLKTKAGAGRWWLTPVNPSYSGGRDQEDCQPRQIVRETLSRKNPTQKKGLVEWLKV